MQGKLQYIIIGITLTLLVLLGASAVFLTDVRANETQIPIDNDVDVINLSESTEVYQHQQDTSSANLRSNDASDNSEEGENGSFASSELTLQRFEKGEAVLATIKWLNEKWLADVLGSSGGWLLLQAERYAPGSSNAPLPNGTHLPERQISEQWLNVQPSGQYNEMFDRMLSASGELIQASFLRDGVSRNTTFGTETRISADPPVLSSLDWGTYWMLKLASDSNAEVTGWIEESASGVPLYGVMAVERFDTPVKFASHSEAVVAKENRSMYDWQSGKFIYGEIVFLTEHGERVIHESITPLAVEIVDVSALPAEALQIFGK